MNTLPDSESEGKQEERAEPPFLRVKDASARSGLSESYLNRLRCVGGGPPFSKKGRVVIYPTVPFDRWMVSGLRTSTSSSTEAA